MASQITSITIVWSTVYSVANQRKHQCSASLAFVQGIHRWTVNSPHKGPVTWIIFPFDDVIMHWQLLISLTYFHSFTHPFIYTHNPSLNISVSLSQLSWLLCHSQSRKEQLIWFFSCFVMKINVFYNYESPVMRLCPSFYFLHQITRSSPYYAGCIRLNSGVKWVKMTNCCE